MTLMSSSICSLFLQLTPRASVMVFPIFLSATAKVYYSSLSTMFLDKNLDKDLGTLPFMSLLMDLKASAVLLNLWKSSRVTLLISWKCTISWGCQRRWSIAGGSRPFTVSLACHIWRERSRQLFRKESTFCLWTFIIIISGLFIFVGDDIHYLLLCWN